MANCPGRRRAFTLDALVPPPPMSPISGTSRSSTSTPSPARPYTTANGAVVPNELQYYDGEMAHFYGECTNVSAVNDALAGSGYKAVTLTSRRRQANRRGPALVEQVHRHHDWAVQRHVHRGRRRAGRCARQSQASSGRTPMAHRACW